MDFDQWKLDLIDRAEAFVATEKAAKDLKKFSAQTPSAPQSFARTKPRVGLAISHRGVERIVIDGKSSANYAETLKLLDQIAPELHKLDLALKGHTTVSADPSPFKNDNGKSGAL
jgi:hypothetical protein